MNDKLVDIPSYAKTMKNGSYYALKRDMPYFSDNENVQGYYVIGKPSDVPGKMIPAYGYYWYCTPEAVSKRDEEKRRKQEAEAESLRREREAEEERERNLGAEYMPLSEAWEDFSLSPLNGFLAEQFYKDTGLSAILEEVLGEERAFLVKLVSTLQGTGHTGALSFSLLSEYPMERHVLFEIDPYFSARIWMSLEEEEIREILQMWIRKNAAGRTSAQSVSSTVTLFHDEYSDRVGGWFSSRVRSGSRHNQDMLLYRDVETGKLLAYEKMKYRFETEWRRESLDEVYTIQNSDFAELRQSSLHFFLPGYYHKCVYAVHQVPASVWILPSLYSDQKELKKQLKELENAPAPGDYRLIRWEGMLEGTKGNWILVEFPDRRTRITENAREYMAGIKKRLQAKSFYPANEDSMSCYFEIEKEGDETDFFDSEPFTVKTVPGAINRYRLDAGRFLCFTTEGEPDERKLIHSLWSEEDIGLQYDSYMNQSETTDMVEEFFDSMEGRDFTLFLGSMYREWIYEHIGDQFNDEYDVVPFSREMAKWDCSVDIQTGSVAADQMPERMQELLRRFGYRLSDVLKWLEACLQQEKYVSREYGDENW